MLLLMFVLLRGVYESWHGQRATPAESYVLSPQSSTFSEQRCAECHAEIVDGFALAPHSRTLTRATDKSVIAEFAGKMFHRNDTGVDFEYELLDGRLFLSTSAFSRKLPIDWIFGSGTHARTPLMTWTDVNGATSGLEHCVSAYPHGVLGTTLGLEELQENAGILALGHPRPPNETINCFGCHCSHVAVTDELIDFEATQPGISCNRCHWDADTHADQMENGRPTTIERFSQLSSLESVNRCGECHRRADEIGGPLDPADTTLPRFASVGLVQSPCFLQQDSVPTASGMGIRLDCTSCHDPHGPTRREWQFHTAVCLNCHDQSNHKAVDCSAASRSDNCLTCHMPKVAAGEHLSFTDHWIRVHQDSPPD